VDRGRDGRWSIFRLDQGASSIGSFNTGAGDPHGSQILKASPKIVTVQLLALDDAHADFGYWDYNTDYWSTSST
jgi:hypothetical protein